MTLLLLIIFFFRGGALLSDDRSFDCPGFLDFSTAFVCFLVAFLAGPMTLFPVLPTKDLLSLSDFGDAFVGSEFL